MIGYENYKLFLDDERYPKQCVSYTGDMEYNDEWVIVRSYDEFVREVKERYSQLKYPSIISFDHDLSFSHYQDSSLFIIGEIPYNEYTEKTGYDCAKFMIDFCDSLGLPFPKYKVHSMNPVGKLNIISVIDNYKKHYAKKENS